MPELAPATEAQGASVEPLRILLAEDDVVSRKVAQLMLGRLGHHVDAVHNGLEAVEAVQRRAYDVVLMDVQMPELDGLAATRRIRKELPADGQPTIIALTAGGLVEHETACTSAGMDACLAKPLRRESLLAVLASVRGVTPPRDPGALPGDVSAPSGGPADSREAAVRTRMTELAGPDPEEDDEMLAALLRSFVSRTPHLLDQLDQAAAAGSTEQVEQVAHALSGAADNVGGNEFARRLQDIENQARGGALPPDELLRELRHEQSILHPVLTAIALQMYPA